MADYYQIVLTLKAPTDLLDARTQEVVRTLPTGAQVVTHRGSTFKESGKTYIRAWEPAHGSNTRDTKIEICQEDRERWNAATYKKDEVLATACSLRLDYWGPEGLHLDKGVKVRVLSDVLPNGTRQVRVVNGALEGTFGYVKMSILDFETSEGKRYSLVEPPWKGVAKAMFADGTMTEISVDEDLCEYLEWELEEVAAGLRTVTLPQGEPWGDTGWRKIYTNDNLADDNGVGFLRSRDTFSVTQERSPKDTDLMKVRVGSVDGWVIVDSWERDELLLRELKGAPPGPRVYVGEDTLYKTTYPDEDPLLPLTGAENVEILAVREEDWAVVRCGDAMGFICVDNDTHAYLTYVLKQSKSPAPKAPLPSNALTFAGTWEAIFEQAYAGSRIVGYVQRGETFHATGMTNDKERNTFAKVCTENSVEGYLILRDSTEVARVTDYVKVQKEEVWGTLVLTREDALYATSESTDCKRVCSLEKGDTLQLLGPPKPYGGENMILRAREARGVGYYIYNNTGKEAEEVAAAYASVVKATYVETSPSIVFSTKGDPRVAGHTEAGEVVEVLSEIETFNNSARYVKVRTPRIGVGYVVLVADTRDNVEKALSREKVEQYAVRDDTKMKVKVKVIEDKPVCGSFVAPCDAEIHSAHGLRTAINQGSKLDIVGELVAVSGERFHVDVRQGKVEGVLNLPWTYLGTVLRGMNEEPLGTFEVPGNWVAFSDAKDSSDWLATLKRGDFVELIGPVVEGDDEDSRVVRVQTKAGMGFFRLGVDDMAEVLAAAKKPAKVTWVANTAHTIYDTHLNARGQVPIGATVELLAEPVKRASGIYVKARYKGTEGLLLLSADEHAELLRGAKKKEETMKETAAAIGVWKTLFRYPLYEDETTQAPRVDTIPEGSDVQVLSKLQKHTQEKDSYTLRVRSKAGKEGYIRVTDKNALKSVAACYEKPVLGVWKAEQLYTLYVSPESTEKVDTTSPEGEDVAILSQPIGTEASGSFNLHVRRAGGAEGYIAVSGSFRASVEEAIRPVGQVRGVYKTTEDGGVIYATRKLSEGPLVGIVVKGTSLHLLSDLESFGSGRPLVRVRTQLGAVGYYLGEPEEYEGIKRSYDVAPSIKQEDYGKITLSKPTTLYENPGCTKSIAPLRGGVKLSVLDEPTAVTMESRVLHVRRNNGQEGFITVSNAAEHIEVTDREDEYNVPKLVRFPEARSLLKTKYFDSRVIEIVPADSAVHVLINRQGVIGGSGTTCKVFVPGTGTVGYIVLSDEEINKIKSDVFKVEPLYGKLFLQHPLPLYKDDGLAHEIKRLPEGVELDILEKPLPTAAGQILHVKEGAVEGYIIVGQWEVYDIVRENSNTRAAHFSEERVLFADIFLESAPLQRVPARRSIHVDLSKPGVLKGNIVMYPAYVPETRTHGFIALADSEVKNILTSYIDNKVQEIPNMANNDKSEKSAPSVAPRFNVKDEAIAAAMLGTAEEYVILVQGLVVKHVTPLISNSIVKKTVDRFVKSDGGAVAIALATGVAAPFIATELPEGTPREVFIATGRTLRVRAMATAGRGVFREVLGPIAQFFINSAATLPADFKASPPMMTAETPEVSGETKVKVAATVVK